MDKALKATILDILSKQTDMTIATLREDQSPGNYRELRERGFEHIFRLFYAVPEGQEHRAP